MEKTGDAPVSAAPAPGSGRDEAAGSGPDEGRGGTPRPRTALDWFGLVALAVAVMITGAFVGIFGPLLAIACDTCEDGLRSPLRFDGALLAVAQVGVPLTTFGSVAGMFFPRGGARVGGIGLGVLVLLLFVMVFLGQFSG